MKVNKLFLRMIMVFGLMMTFTVSGWGACGNSNGSWSPSSTAVTGSVTTTSEYYTITLASAGTLNISVENTYSGSGTRTLTATLYPDNGQCTTASIWNGTIAKHSTVSFNNYVVPAGTYSLKLVSSSTSNTGYSLTGSFVTPPVINAQTFSVAENSASGTSVGTVSATNSPTAYNIVGGTGQSLFNISSGGVITVKTGAVLDYETNTSYTLLVNATNAAGTSSDATITVNLTNVAGPTIASGQSFTITSGLANGTTVGTLNVTVPTPLPSGDTTTYTISNPDFAISNTGVITIANSSALTVGTYTVTVGASNAEGNDSKTITIIVNAPSADLGITKTASSPVMVGNQIVYTISITNNGPNGTDLNMTDILNSNLTYVNVYDDAHEWVCAYTSATRTVLCQHPNILANGATTTITLIATAPNSVMTVSNTASVIGTVQDPNTNNNTSSVNVSVVASSFTNSNPRNFTLQKQYNINGDMKIIGNTIMQDAATHSCANPTATNNNITVEYVDIDSNTSTFNSTSANITLPAGTTSDDIAWAGLYWQGYYGNGTTDTIKTNAKTVLLKRPGSSTYSSIQSDSAKFNWVYFDDAKTRWYYQGAQDVTSLVKSGLSGDYTVANVYSQTGGGINGGGFGAWSLMVVYKDKSATLKNISVYDGYVGISSSDAGRTGVYANTTVPLSGFFTPTTGNVNSTFMSFVGEGDIGISGDYGSLSNSSGDIRLYNSLNPVNNLFNATISDNGGAVTTRNPQCPNNIGIDIDTFDVGSTASATTQGQIIQNGQTSTNVKLSSSGDGYFPGLFAFATDLYIPDVCYLEDVTLNGSLIGAGNEPTTGDTVEYQVSISNKANETAKGVFVEKPFDKPREITYVPGSMSIAPIPGTTFSAKTDTLGDDTAEYNNDTNMSKYLLGTGATWYEGGSLVKDAVTKFKYQAQVGDQNASENIYFVSYRNDLLHITFNGIPIRKCNDFNNSFAVTASGAYQVVDAGQNCGGQMFTKVVNQGYNVDMVSCDGSNNLITPSTTKTIDITYADATKNPIVGAPAVSSISFPAGQNRVSNVSIAAYDKATKSINLATSSDGGTTWSSISNSFAVRPKNFHIVSTPVAGTKIKAGQNFALEFQGLDAVGNNTQNYSDTADINFAVTVADQQPACLTGVFNPDIKTGWSFTNGTNTLTTNYPEVGIVNITATETSKPCGQRFASVDCSDSDITNLNIEDGTATLTFIPDHFSVAGTLNNKGNGFTYLSADLNMSADLNITLTAQNAANGTTHNYNAACYAKNIDLNVSYNAPVINPANGVTQLLYRETQTNTNGINNPIGTLMLINTLSPANIFTQALAGVGYPDIKFNFNRSQTIPVNPFAFTVNVINIRDVDSVTGTQNLNSNATFAYGRFVPRDIRVFGQNPFTAIGWYEVFNSPTLGATLLTPSKNENMWYINQLHDDATDGDANIVSVLTATNTVLPLSPVSNGTGIETYPFAGETPPYSAKAHIAVSPWLWYGPAALTYTTPGTDCSTHPCFNINVVPSVGATGSSKDQNVGAKTNKSTSDGAGVWKSTRDYAPAIR